MHAGCNLSNVLLTTLFKQDKSLKEFSFFKCIEFLKNSLE